MSVGEAAPVADERVARARRTEEPRYTSVPVRGVRHALFPIWNRFIAIVDGQRDPEGGEFAGAVNGSRNLAQSPRGSRGV